LKRGLIFLLIGGGMLFVTFIFLGIISFLVMTVIEAYEIGDDFPDGQKFIHEKLPVLSNLQLIGSIFLNGGILMLILGGVFYCKDRKRAKNQNE